MADKPITLSKKPSKRELALHAAQTAFSWSRIDAQAYFDIHIDDTAALEAAIKAVAPRDSHRRHTVARIRSVADWAEQELIAKKVPVSQRQGYTAADRMAGRDVSKRSANRFPQPDPATIIRLFRDAGGWRLVRIGKTVVFPNQAELSALSKVYGGRVSAGAPVPQPPAPAPAPIAAGAVKADEQKAGLTLKMGGFRVRHSLEGLRTTPEEALQSQDAWAEWSAQEARRLRQELIDAGITPRW